MADNSDQSAKKRRGPGKPFQKGVSGNPGGRPPELAHVKELARAYTEEAISTLAAVMGNPDSPPAARVKSAEVLLDRAWGKAEATVHVKDHKDVRELSRAEILAALAAHGVTGEAGSSEQPGPVH